MRYAKKPAGVAANWPMVGSDRFRIIERLDDRALDKGAGYHREILADILEGRLPQLFVAEGCDGAPCICSWAKCAFLRDGSSGWVREDV